MVITAELYVLRSMTTRARRQCEGCAEMFSFNGLCDGGSDVWMGDTAYDGSIGMARCPAFETANHNEQF